MKKLILLAFILTMAGCANYNAYIKDNLAGIKADKVTIISDWGVAFSLKVDAEKLRTEDGKIKAKVIEYNRTGNISSAHIRIEGYERDLSDE